MASAYVGHSLPETLQTWVSMAFFWFSSDFPASFAFLLFFLGL